MLKKKNLCGIKDLSLKEYLPMGDSRNIYP